MSCDYSDVIDYLINKEILTTEQIMSLKSSDLKTISESKAYASWKLNKALKSLVSAIKKEMGL